MPGPLPARVRGIHRKSPRTIPQLATVCAVVACAAMLPPAATASATTITFSDYGMSIKGTALAVSATLATAADAGGPNNALQITLRSVGAPTQYASDVLSSFYFNLANPTTGRRPVLTYVSGTGQAFEVHAGSAIDTPVSWSPQIWTVGSTTASNLVAVNPFDEGWQFKTIIPPPAFPGLGFGIGTVGNSNIADFIPGATGSFDGRVVRGREPASMINLGIYSVGGGSDIDPAGVLDGARLVRTQAVFRFLADVDLNPVNQSWVQGNVTFGFGTGPDMVLLPEPGTLPMVATAGVVALGWLVRRRIRRRKPLG